MTQWNPDMSAAPKDGTPVVLTWMENGEPQEIYPGMQWNPSIGNSLVQSHKGIWAMHSNTGEVLFTWTEDNEGGPTHWMLMKDYLQ